MIFVYRPGYEKDIDHPSESQYKEYLNYLRESEDGPISDSGIPFDWFMVNDGTIEDVMNKLEKDIVPYFSEYLNRKN